MRRRLHDWFGWHAWTNTSPFGSSYLWMLCKCGATSKALIA